MSESDELMVRHKVDVDAYYRMAREGILGPEDRVELVGGEVLDLIPPAELPDGELMARHKWDVEAYYRMAEVGILGPNDRVELIGGEIIDMAPIGRDHMTTVDGLNEVLMQACVGRAILRCQGPIRLDRFNDLQPDFAVFRFRRDRYRDTDANAQDALLLVEVSVSSLRYDRVVKLPLYARYGVPEVWIADPRRRVVRVHRQPAGDAYAEVTEHRAGAVISLAAAPAIVVTLTDVVFG